MATGGMDFDNPAFDKDDYDKDDDRDDDDELYKDDEQFQRTLNTQYEALDTFTGFDREKEENSLLETMTKGFYERNQETFRKVECFLKQDKVGRPMLYVTDDSTDIPLSFYKTKNPEAPIQFYSFDTLQRKYGVNFVRDVLGVTDFDPSAARIKKGRKEFQALISTRNNLSAIEEHIPLQDISSPQEIQDLTNTVDEVETAVKTVYEEIAQTETSFTETTTTTTATQTKVDMREMDGILKAMTTVKEELTNELAKLAETNKDLAKEHRKLEQATSDGDEFQIERISSRIRDLESERSARLEVINVNRDILRSQVNRIKETINKVLKEDTTLAERIKTLFREQGITIVSVLTAFGMIIAVIVEAVIPTTGGGTTTPEPPPKDGGGVKDWIQKQLKNIGKLLAKLAGKAAVALPGIIGSIVSWLLSTLGKTVTWFGEHLWAVVMVVAGLLFTAASNYINQSNKKR